MAFKAYLTGSSQYNKRPNDRVCLVDGGCVSLRKHPFLLALRRWGRFARRNVVPPRQTSPAAKSEEKRMSSQAMAVYVVLKRRVPAQ